MILSKCCHAPVISEEVPTETIYGVGFKYQNKCTKCGWPCDVANYDEEKNNGNKEN